MKADSRFFWYAIDVLLYLAALGLLMAYAVVAIDTISWMTFLALALGTYRLGDIIAEEEVMSVVREPFAGHHVGFRGAVCKGIHCSSCVGVWSALILVACAVVLPPYGLIFPYALALSGAERIVSRVINVLEQHGK